jgi:hypothetical protein
VLLSSYQVTPLSLIYLIPITAKSDKHCCRISAATAPNFSTAPFPASAYDRVAVGVHYKDNVVQAHDGSQTMFAAAFITCPSRPPSSTTFTERAPSRCRPVPSESQSGWQLLVRSYQYYRRLSDGAGRGTKNMQYARCRRRLYSLDFEHHYRSGCASRSPTSLVIPSPIQHQHSTHDPPTQHVHRISNTNQSPFVRSNWDADRIYDSRPVIDADE